MVRLNVKPEFPSKFLGLFLVHVLIITIFTTTNNIYIMKKSFKIGNQVVMHTCGEADHYPGKVWKCRSDSFMDSANQEVVFLEGFGGHFLCEFLQLVLVKPSLTDRFFMEEIVKRIHNEDREYFTVLTKDWLKEFIKQLPLTEEERSEHIKSQGWDEDFINSAYFSSEEAMRKFLGID